MYLWMDTCFQSLFFKNDFFISPVKRHVYLRVIDRDHLEDNQLPMSDKKGDAENLNVK